MTEQSPVARLRSAQKTLIDAVVTRYEDGEWWRFTVNLVLVVGGGLLVAIARLGSIEEPHQSWMSGIGLAMVGLGGALVAIFDRRRVSLTTSARQALDLSQDFLDERAGLEARIEAADRLDARRRFLLRAVELMQEAVERIPLKADIVSVITAMLDAGTNELEGAIGFEPGEKWSFGIFRCEARAGGPGNETMRRIAVTLADRSLDKAAGREWEKREGFAGVAWQRNEEVIEPDLRLPEVAAQYPVPDNKQKKADAQRYISVVAIPVRVGSSETMWGAVVATSDCAGRWRRAPTDPREQNVMAVRMLAQLISMQVALRN